MNAKSNEIYALVLLFLFAFILRIWDVSTYSIWFDEALNFRIASNSWDALWISNYDPTPPLYYTLLKLYINGQTSELSMRFVSLLFGSLSVAVFYKICELFCRKRIAFLVSVLFALSVHQIEYSQEARAYAMQFFFGLSAFYCVLQLIVSENLVYRRLITYVLLAACALYTHNISVFYILGFNLCVFYHCYQSSNKELFKRWFIANSILFLIWLPWPLVTVLSGEGNSFNWLKHISPIQFVLSTAKSIKISADPESVSFWDIAFIGLLCIGFVSLIKNKAYQTIYILIFMGFSTLCLVWLTGYVKPIFMARTILFSTVISYLLLAICLSSLKERFSIPIYIVTVSLHLFYFYDFTTHRASENEQWAQALNYVQDNASTRLLVCTPSASWAISFYNRENTFSAYIISESDVALTELELDLAKKIEAKKAGENQLLQETDIPVSNSQLTFMDSHCGNTTRDRIAAVFDLSPVKSLSFEGIELFTATVK
tara:strand:+ start:170 stop:1627 length:1458 start_codon:yes stop_codon:yes gene_type:complete